MTPLEKRALELGIEDPERFCADPGSDPVVLARLAKKTQHQDRLGAAIAGNPAIALDTMISMIRMHALEVSQNPSFRIRWACDPAFIDGLPVHTRACLARCAGVDERLLRTLSESRSRPVFVRCSAARNPGCPEDLLDSFVRGGHAWAVRQATAWNPALPGHLQMALARDPRVAVRMSVAERRDASTELLEWLSRPDEHERVRRAVARNRRTPTSILHRLLEASSADLQGIVLLRLGASPTDLERAFQTIVAQGPPPDTGSAS
jgi:hypothetical protein